MLTDYMLLKVPVILMEGVSMTLSEAKSKVRQFIAAQYPADLENSSTAAPKEVGSIDLLTSDLEGDADSDLAD